MACVGRELLCALDFTFLQGTFLQGEVSLPRRGRKPEGLLVHNLEGTFRLDSPSEAKIFRAREEPKISTAPYATVALDSTQRGDGFSERARK